MATDGATFDQWLRDAKIDRQRLTADQVALLEASFHFVQRCGGDYYSRRVLSHFLLHCQSGLKVAQIARILSVSRSTASEQQNVSSKEMVQAAHHRMAGRPHGKLLARYAGPVAQFLITHPKASRLDILDFIERTWEVRASTVALYHFMKKYGLDRAQRSLASAADTSAVGAGVVQAAGLPEASLPVPQAEFFLPRRSTPGRSSSCRSR
jgi:transposase